MSEYKAIFDKNIERVESLHALYTKLKQDEQKDGKDYKLTDILRSEVVFLHSSFEEYFRCVLIDWLPTKATDETLKEIPISINAGKKAEKLFLSDLAHYRGKKIDDIIYESVAETMKLKSFNNEAEIKIWCNKIGISLNDFDKIKDVDKAVHRRHKIVHEADTNRNKEGEGSKLQGIKPGDIQPWIVAYKKLVEFIDSVICEWEKEKCHD